MSVVLALGAAMVYGSADFLGGLASRRRTAISVAFGSQAAGLVALVVVLGVMGSAPVAGRDLVAGAVGGVFGAVGLVMLYRSLARGPMSVVAPVTAMAASLVPILAGLVLGERPGGAALLGIAVALAAVLLVTRVGPGAAADDDDKRRSPSDDATILKPRPVRGERSGTQEDDADAGGEGMARSGRAEVSASVVGTAVASGALFGLFFVCLHATGDDAGLHPLLGARLASVLLLGTLAVTRGEGLGRALTGRGALAVAAAGVLDMGANVLYLAALRHGLLAVVSATTGLYPAATVLLAQTVLDERMRRTQLVGLAAAGLAAGLVAL